MSTMAPRTMPATAADLPVAKNIQHYQLRNAENKKHYCSTRLNDGVGLGRCGTDVGLGLQYTVSYGWVQTELRTQEAGELIATTTTMGGGGGREKERILYYTRIKI